MNDASLLDESKLTVVLDMRHPMAYLALGPAAEPGRELGIAINGLPLVVASLNPQFWEIWPRASSFRVDNIS